MPKFYIIARKIFSQILGAPPPSPMPMLTCQMRMHKLRKNTGGNAYARKDTINAVCKYLQVSLQYRFLEVQTGNDPVSSHPQPSMTSTAEAAFHRPTCASTLLQMFNNYTHSTPT